MNLFFGEITALFTEQGLTMGRIRVGRALTRAPLSPVREAEPRDVGLVCDGVTLEKVRKPPAKQKETHVPGDSR
jgi:hypothetical protein